MKLYQYITSKNPELSEWMGPLIWAGWISLCLGVFLPILNMKKGVWIFEIEDSTFSLISGIWTMLTEGHFVLGVIVFVFSIIVPIIKIGTISLLWNNKLSDNEGHAMLLILSFISKWSMLDVFVVAVIVVVSKLSSYADAEAKIGIYVFGIHVLLTMILSKVFYHYDSERLTSR